MSRFVDALAERLALLTPDEAAVSRHCFRSLLHGQAAPVASIAASVGRPAREIQSALQALVERGMLVVTDAVVTVARGLSRPATAHRLTLGAGRSVYACCAIDAIGIPAALRMSARVASLCHACAEPVAVDVAAGRVEHAPAGLLIWAADLDLGRSLREYT